MSVCATASSVREQLQMVKITTRNLGLFVLVFFLNDFYWENYKKNVQYKVNSLTLNL